MNIHPILSIEEERKIHQKNILYLLKKIVLKGDCWHVQLETILGNLLEPPASSITEYKISCPKCCNEIKTFVMPVKRSVLSVFLSDTFINNLLGQIIPKILVQTLYVYPEVGKVVYNQPRSNKAPVLIF